MRRRPPSPHPRSRLSPHPSTSLLTISSLSPHYLLTSQPRFSLRPLLLRLQPRSARRLHLIPSLLEVRNPVRHPLRRGSALQLVREELLQLEVDVLLIRALARIVTLAVVRNHVRLLLEPAHGE